MRQKISSLKISWLVVIFLLLGVIFKLYVTSNNNIIFHMDSARDFVDVREMVELGKPRLIGQTSGIEGFYNGPGWYYLLAIPYILFDGDPYGGVVLMIVMWAIGGYFLYLITKKYGILAWFSSLVIWFASPFISLSTMYSFNPHPILYLTPLFVFLLERYIKTGIVWYGLGTSLLSALFFQWEMNTGVFMPLIVLASIIIARKISLLKTKGFWFSILLYAASFLPQLLFDLKHQFIMSQAVLRFLGEGGAGKHDYIKKIFQTWDIFFASFVPTLLNSSLMVKAVLILFVVVMIYGLAFRKKESFKNIDLTFCIFLLLIIIPFIGYIFLPVNVYTWHMVSVIVAFIGVIAFLLHSLTKRFPIGWGIGILFLLFCLINSGQAIYSGIKEHGKISDDPSNLRNELNAIDFAYAEANGQNFKAYSYLPSVIDYPYQYLYWWYGLAKYGYTPSEYLYLPDKPQYISNKELFNQPKKDAIDSSLILLIKEPDRIKMRHLWEGNFAKYELKRTENIGPLVVEVRTFTQSAQIQTQ